MKKNISLVLTTINKFNKIKKIDYITKKNSIRFIVIGDKKTNKNFKTIYGYYFDIKSQKKLGFNYENKCPYNSYSRKNIGYLLAIKKKSSFIFETDDDNAIDNKSLKDIFLNHKAINVTNAGWVNIYKTFLKNKNIEIWPRGLPLENINNKAITGKSYKKNYFVQQGICNGDPDVDAIFRLINKKRNFIFKKNIKLSIGPRTFVPLNSQNTIWYQKAFPLLYLPSYCSMRATDIWRGLIAKIILSNDNKFILYKSSDVYQKRNYHNLIKDLKEEMEMYRNLNFVSKILTNLKMVKGHKNYSKNLIIIYEKLVKLRIFPKKELSLVKLWIADIDTLSKST